MKPGFRVDDWVGDLAWEHIAIQAAPLFVRYWGYGQDMESKADRRPPSVCDLAAEMEIDLVSAVALCKGAVSEGKIWMSDSGHLYLGPPPEAIASPS